jgi:hypothetical protein
MKPCVAALMTKPSAAQRSCQKGVQAKAAIRAEVMSWGLTDATIDPGEQLLRVVTRSAARAEMYTQKLKFSASLGPCSSTMGDTRARTTNPADRASYLINDAARLLAALRLSAQNQYRSDEVVREILETPNLATLAEVAGKLRQTGGVDAVAASRTVTEIVRFPSGQLLAIASCALRAL